MTKADRTYPTEALIGGTWMSSQITFPVTNPATGAVIADVPDLGKRETEAAISAAHAAFHPWAARPAKERSAIIRKWHDLLVQETESLASLMTAEQGKPLAEARGEVAYGASFVEWFAEEGKRAYGHTIPTTSTNRRFLTIKQPIGVAAAITPWNFPIAMIARKVSCALAAGCTIVVKPAEETPLCALAIAKLAEEAGVPAGVINVVTTSKPAAVGAALCADPRVRKLSFTGSTSVGKTLYRQCADTLKKMTLELGGNAPILVFDDADLGAAIEGTMISKFRNAGQTCVCANRILVQSGIYDRFAAALTATVKDLSVGPGDIETTTIGPLINEPATEKVARLVDDAVKKGADATVGGKRSAVGTLYFEPTVLTNVTQNMHVTSEEIFGPVASLIKFETEDEAIRIANDTPYGLAGYLFTQDITRAWRVAEQLETGIASINEGLFSNEAAPFGGVKESGIGREGAQEGLDEYLETKFICLGGMA